MSDAVGQTVVVVRLFVPLPNPRFPLVIGEVPFELREQRRLLFVFP